MKNSDIYDAFSGIDEKYRIRSENYEGIAAAFKRARIQRMEKIISFAASMVLVIIAGINVYDKNDIMRQSSMIGSSYTEIKTSTPEETEVSAVTAESSTAPVSNAYKESTSKKVSDNQSVTYKPVTSNSGKYKETAPDLPASDVTEVKTAPVTSNPPENSVSDKPASSAPPETCPPSEYAPVSDTTAETDDYDTSASTSYSPSNWEEMDINEKFFGCDFEGIYYQSLKRSIDSAYIGEYLGVADMSGYDSRTDTYYHCKALVYRIGDKPENDTVAVMFEGDDRFFLYSSCFTNG